MAIYMKFKGARSGEIKGSVSTSGAVDWIEIHSLEFGLGSPFDAITGQTTGRRIARPLKIVKPLDRSTPLLINACDVNDSAEVTFVYLKEGGDHKNFFTIALTKAMIRDINHLGVYSGSATETLTLSYVTSEITWVTGGIVASLDWSRTA